MIFNFLRKRAKQYISRDLLILVVKYLQPMDVLKISMLDKKLHAEYGYAAAEAIFREKFPLAASSYEVNANLIREVVNTNNRFITAAYSPSMVYAINKKQIKLPPLVRGTFYTSIICNHGEQLAAKFEIKKSIFGGRLAIGFNYFMGDGYLSDGENSVWFSEDMRDGAFAVCPSRGGAFISNIFIGNLIKKKSSGTYSLLIGRAGNKIEILWVREGETTGFMYRTSSNPLHPIIIGLTTTGSMSIRIKAVDRSA